MAATPTNPAPTTNPTQLQPTQPTDVVQVRITLHPTAIPPARVPLTTRIRRLQNTFTADQQPVAAATRRFGGTVVASSWVGRTLDVQLPQAALNDATRALLHLPAVEKIGVATRQQQPAEQPAGQPAS